MLGLLLCSAGVIASLPVICIGAFLIGWGLIAFSPCFQENAGRDFGHFSECATSAILILQALGAFAAPYYVNLAALLMTDLPAQFFLTGALYLVLAAIAFALSTHKGTA